MPVDQHTRREMLRRLGLVTAVGLGATAPFSGSVLAGDGSEGERSHAERDTTVESFDGTELAVTEYTPEGEGPFPAVLITHGWANDRKTEGPVGLANLYVDNGYFVLTYDSRGFGASEGLVGVDGADEIGDVQALLDYLAAHDAVRSDGDDPVVGMDGFSYAGGIQLRAAAADDRLDALIPRWAWNDLRFSNDPNGVIKWPWFYVLYVSGLYGSLGLIPDPSRGLDFDGDGVPDIEREFLDLSQEAVGEGEASDALREFWAGVSPGPQDELADIDAPTLLVHGWHDRLFTPNEAFDNYRGIAESGTEARLLMYDGGHDLVGAPGEEDPAQLAFLADAAVRFFDRQLKGEEDVEALSPVTVYRDDAEEFETYEALPDGERTLSLREAAGPGTTRLSTAPGGQTSAAFDFDVERPTDLVGAGELKLRLTPRGDRPTVSAALATVDDEGRASVLKDQVTVTPVEGRGNTTVSLDLAGVETALEPGDTLRLLVGVSDDDLAPFLTAEGLFGGPDGFFNPERLRDDPAVADYIPDEVPRTDGLYFDSPEEPATGVVIQHTTPEESTVTVSTVNEEAGGTASDDESDGNTNRGGNQRSDPLPLGTPPEERTLR